jgi:hypothetical protein
MLKSKKVIPSETTDKIKEYLVHNLESITKDFNKFDELYNAIKEITPKELQNDLQQQRTQELLYFMCHKVSDAIGVDTESVINVVESRLPEIMEMYNKQKGETNA